MDGERVGRGRRLRLGLRGMLILLLVIAAVLAALRPLVREALGWLEHYVRVSLNKEFLERDMYRHLDDGQRVAERFAEALRSGRLEDARGLMTTDFRRRVGPSEFAAMAARSPLSREPSELVKGVMSFSDGRGQIVSEYVFRCGRGGEGIALVLVTEAGQVKVDRIEPKEPGGE